MSPDPSRHFGCEVYLYAFAAGARDGLVRQHIDDCLFCRDIVHGGTDEFPQSYEDEVAAYRLSRRRSGRRRFLKIAAAAVVGLAMVGGTGVIASKWARHRPTELRQHQRAKSYDGVYAAQGRQGIAAIMASANEYERSRLCTWIGDRGHVQLVDLIVDNVSDPSLTVRTIAVQQLRRFNPAALVGYKSYLLTLQVQEPDDLQRELIDELIVTIP